MKSAALLMLQVNQPVRRDAQPCRPLPDSSIGDSIGTNSSAQQLQRYLSVINSAAVDPITDEESRMDKLIVDFPLLRPLFARVFCVPASSAPVERIFSQSGIIMSARTARMSNSLFEASVFLKCNAHL